MSTWGTYVRPARVISSRASFFSGTLSSFCVMMCSPPGIFRTAGDARGEAAALRRLHRDLARLRLLLLGHANREDSVLVARLRARRIDVRRQLERAGEL